MPALEILGGFVTAPDTTLTALTMGSGNSLTVRNAPENSDVRLIQAWVDVQGTGIFRIRSPHMHDNVYNMSFQTVASEVDPLMPNGFFQPLTPQDTIVAELSGSATSGDIEQAFLLLWYSELPGIAGRFLSPEAIRGSLKNILCVANTISTGTAGGWSGAEAINAEQDVLKGNTDYAILGYHTSVEAGAIRWRAADFGNLGVGGPGNEMAKQFTANWFVWVSNMLGVPAIPIFNSADKANVLIDAFQDENGGDPIVNTILAELG